MVNQKVRKAEHNISCNLGGGMVAYLTGEKEFCIGDRDRRGGSNSYFERKIREVKE